jgi:hypothetical protein
MNRFWKRNDPAPFHDVTHRAIGDIPGCTPAPESSTYRPVALHIAQHMNIARANRFAIALDTDQYGPSFRGSSLAEPLYGPYGEKL